MIKEKIINNIKTIRESKNLTEEYIAGQMGISQSTYNRKENGLTDFSLTELIQLSDVLEVSVSKFIDMDLAQIINQYNSDTASGNYQTISNDEGYKAAIAAYEKETTFLRAQVEKLTDALAGK